MKGWLTIGLVIGLICLALLGIGAKGCGGGSSSTGSSAPIWTISFIDEATNNMGEDNDITIDSNNNLHISYKDYSGDNTLKYAFNITGTWVTATIDSNLNNDTGRYNSIDVDPNNKLHISYYEENVAPPNALKYATNVTGTWVTSTIDNSADEIGEYISIAVTGTGITNVHISYIDSTNADLKYATNITGSWVITPLDTANIYYDTSIAIDSNNKVHISYYDAGNDDLKYATNVTGSWVTSTIDDVGVVGEWTSIAIDFNNKVHISYSQLGTNFLKYITNVSGGWVKSIVDNSGGIAYHNAIALDSNNKVHISYYDWINNKLKYATNISGTWSISTLDNLDDVLESDTSIAIDSNNKVHITYCNKVPGRWHLKYATNK